MLDSMISVDSALLYITEWGMGHSNQRAFELVSDETLAGLQLPRDPTELLESGVLYCRFKDKDEVIRRFQEMKAGV